MFPLHEPIKPSVREALFEYDDFVASLLARRGITTSEAARMFLNPSYDEHVHDPLLITDMEKAAKRLARAILSGEPIAAWTDYDCDGIPAAVILHDFLRKAGATFEVYIPHRHTEGYGMNVSGVEALARRGVSLIVTADSGITDVEPVEKAHELGIDVIVTDHHLPGSALPGAYAVVDPNARTEETALFRLYCGAGLAWKLVCATLAVEPKLRERVPVGWEKWLLDMVAIATVADMVPLVGENRVLTSYGLKVLRKSPRIGFQKLCRGMNVNQRTLTEDDIGFMIAPRVNAASRMGDAVDAFKLFTTTDETEADALAKKLEKLNRERKAQAGAITRAVRKRLSEREVGSVITLGDPTWRPSLLGLVANGIAEEYDRPVFLWGREGNNTLKGSCRSNDVVNVVDLMEQARDVFVEFGGHAASGGFTVKDDRIFDLETRLIEVFDTIATNSHHVTDYSLRADTVIDPSEVTESLLLRLDRLSPFGEGNLRPVFLLKDVTVATVSRFGKGEEHVKIKIERTDGLPLEAVTFFAKGSLAHVIETMSAPSRAHVLGHLERDTFSRRGTPRMRLLAIVAA